jgi:hypothetical protein
MAALTLEQTIPYIKQWLDATSSEQISLYQQAEEPIRKIYLRSLNHCSLTSLGGLSSSLVRFFESLHDPRCDHCKGSDEECVSSPWQQDAFQVMGLDRAAILANDDDLNYRKGWVRLITSLDDEDTQAKVVIDLRISWARKSLLAEMDIDTRKRILEKISELQTQGYPTLDGYSWFWVATPTFNSVCGVCGEKYDEGDTILKKTCGVHTSHMGCAKEKWGRSRRDWLADPCQLCTEKGC